jgi:ketosteroid isomerase-like protein
MARSSMAAFSALWRAYGEGRLDRALHLVDPDCEFTLPGGRSYEGHDGIRDYLSATRHDWRTVAITYDDVREDSPGCIVAIGRVAASSADGTTSFERPQACVAEFRDGLFVRGRVFGDPAEAAAYAADIARDRAAGRSGGRSVEPERGSRS